MSGRPASGGLYAVLHVHYFYDDRIDEVGERAEVLFVRSIAYCASAMSDGFMTDRQVRRIVGMGLDDVDDRCKALVESGLWTRDDERGGYVVTNYLKWNRSKEDISMRRAREAARKRWERSPDAAKKSPDGVRADTDGTTDGVRVSHNTAQHNTAQHNTEHTASDRTSQGPVRSDATRVPAPPPPELAELRERLSKRSAVRRAREAR